MSTIKFEEVVVFIKEMAVLHASAVEEWDYEYFEAWTFRRIIEFAADEKDIAFETFSKELFNAPGDDSEPDFYNPDLYEIMERHQEQRLLSEKTSKLFSLYKREFWGGDE